MNKEIWRDIKDYEGLYQISNFGNVKSFLVTVNGRNMKAGNRSGYLTIGLTKSGVAREFYIHRLVAQAFVPNPENKPFINHINGVRNDNVVENLEWCTHSENIKHAFKTGLAKSNLIGKGKFGALSPFSKPIIQLDDDGNIVNEYASLSEASMNGFSRVCLSHCLNGRSKKHKKFTWKFKK